MLSVHSIKAGGGGSAASYYEGLAREDYYNEGGEPPGVYLGRFADSLGLTGEQVQKGELTNLLTGHHPRTGEEISTQIHTKAGHKPGWDLTFSAPKSVSVVWATASKEDREAISRAQARAVDKALAYVEDKALHTRHGHAGRDKEQHTGGVIAAAFEHSTSRNGDPQLHTHVIVANLCEEGRRIDLDTRWKMAAGAIYRVELANELRRHGYQVARDERSFALVGVPDGLEEKWSSRRAEIEAALKDAGMDTAKAAAVAALDTRETKTDINRAELFREWRETAREAGFDPASLKHQTAQPLPEVTAQELAHRLTEKASTSSEMQLEALVYQEAQGVLSGDRARALAEAMKASPALVRLEKQVGSEFGRAGEVRYTTPEMIAIERSMANRAEVMAKDCAHPVSAEAITRAIEARTLSGEQQTALRYVTGHERLALIQGSAGAGKSYMLDAAREAWQASGYEVHGAALAGKAADGLQKSSGIEAETIHKTLHDLRSGDLRLHEKSVMVVDEAGMVDSRQMAELVKKVDEVGAKLVLVGDSKQLQPIDAGGAMRALDERVGSVAMDQIRRQEDAAERRMVMDLKAGRVDAVLDHLASRDRLHIHEKADGARQAAAWGVVNDLAAEKSAVALADTRAAVAEINGYARAAMRATDQLKGEDKPFKTADAQRQFAAGDRLVFLKNDRDLGVKNGTTGEVIRAGDGALLVRLDGNTNAPRDTWPTVVIEQERYSKVDHGYATTVHKSQGATVACTHYVAGDLASQELGYVAGSRHRESFNAYITQDQFEEVRERLGTSQQKDTTLDYNSISRIPDELRNERPGYNADARANADDWQRTAARGLPEPDPGRTAREGAPQEHTSMRDVSNLPVVHEFRGAEVLLSKDAQRELAEERAADRAMRREGAGRHGSDGQAGHREKIDGLNKGRGGEGQREPQRSRGAANAVRARASQQEPRREASQARQEAPKPPRDSEAEFRQELDKLTNAIERQREERGDKEADHGARFRVGIGEKGMATEREGWAQARAEAAAAHAATGGRDVDRER